MHTTFDGLIIRTKIFLKIFLWKTTTQSLTNDCELTKRKNEQRRVPLDSSWSLIWRENTYIVFTIKLFSESMRTRCIISVFLWKQTCYFWAGTHTFLIDDEKNETWRVPRQSIFFAWHDLTHYFSFDVVWIEKSMHTGNFMHVYGFWFLGS